MMESENVVKLPTYLSRDSIKKALRKAHAESDVTIEHCEVKRDSVEGENFCSDIYRAQVKYKCITKGSGGDEVLEKSLILKDMHLNITELGTNEYEMYEHILPKMELILSEGLGRRVVLNPKVFLIDRLDKELYIMEDLNAAGFKMGNRWLGLDEAHARCLLEKIAQFHAASKVYVEKYPADITALKKCHMQEGATDAISKSITFGGIQHAIGIVEKWPGFEDTAEKMRRSLYTFNERASALTSEKGSAFNVINHGDLWVNNFLYSYDQKGRPKDVVFIDFQSATLGSPGLDINYLLNTSVQLEVLKTSRYELLRHYYIAFQRTLSACGATNIPTWQIFMEEVRRLEFMGYYAAVCELPICCMSQECSKGFTQQILTDPIAMIEKRRFMYSNERVLKTLRYTLDRFNELGVLD